MGIRVRIPLGLARIAAAEDANHPPRRRQWIQPESAFPTPSRRRGRSDTASKGIGVLTVGHAIPKAPSRIDEMSIAAPPGR
jgi:hypothetical protein